MNNNNFVGLRWMTNISTHVKTDITLFMDGLVLMQMWVFG